MVIDPIDMRFDYRLPDGLRECSKTHALKEYFKRAASIKGGAFLGSGVVLWPEGTRDTFVFKTPGGALLAFAQVESPVFGTWRGNAPGAFRLKRGDAVSNVHYSTSVPGNSGPRFGVVVHMGNGSSIAFVGKGSLLDAQVAGDG